MTEKPPIDQEVQKEIDACEQLARAFQKVKVSKPKKRHCFDGRGKPCDIIGEAIVKAGLKPRLGKVFSEKQALYNGKKGPVFIEAADTVKKIIPSLSLRAENLLCDMQVALDTKSLVLAKHYVKALVKELKDHAVALEVNSMMKSIVQRS